MGPFGNRAPGGMGPARAGQRRGGVRWWVLLLFAGYMGYYWLSNKQDASFTGRSQLIDTSVEEEAALGLQSFQEVLSQSNVVTQGELPGQVSAIAQRLVAAAPKVEEWLATNRGIPKSVRWDAFDWQVAVIDSEQANAFCLPGGKIAVYTGIIPVAQNADALAAVMGHEIAHALLRHGAERMAQQKLVQIGSMATGMAIGDMDPGQQQMVMAALGAGAQYGVLLPFSRDHETEADMIGLMISAAGCFDQRESIGLWERMGANSGGQSPPEFASTHPASTTRISNLQGWMSDAMTIRDAMGCPPLANP